jgi:RHS repeat-associated protein
VRKQGGLVKVTVYIDGIFEFQRIALAGAVEQNNTLHVMDNQSRIALVRVGNPFVNDTTPAVKYHLGDHLGSSNLVLNSTGNLVNREEYTPYGETSFGSFSRKRFRFAGKEKDEESGLNYHEARYYASWLIRWASCDPAGPVADLPLYSYSQNPLSFTDPQGTEPQDKQVASEVTVLGESTGHWETGKPGSTDPATGTTIASESKFIPDSPQSQNRTLDDLNAFGKNVEEAKIDVLKATKDEAVSVVTDVLRSVLSGSPVMGLKGPLAPLTDPQLDKVEKAATTPEDQRSTTYSVASGVLLVGSLVTPGVGEEAAASRAPALVRRAQRSRAYSVAVEVTLESKWGKGIPKALRRKLHRIEAEDLIRKKVETLTESLDPVEKKAGEKLSKLLTNAKDWHVHHDPFRKGAMQLVPKVQHQAKQLQDLFHPYLQKYGKRVGGFKIWGKQF